jgi:hypothetical protein
VVKENTLQALIFLGIGSGDLATRQPDVVNSSPASPFMSGLFSSTFLVKTAG